MFRPVQQIASEPVDDDASPEVLETMEAAANIHEGDTRTPDGGKLMVGQGYAGASNRTYQRLSRSGGLMAPKPLPERLPALPDSKD